MMNIDTGLAIVIVAVLIFYLRLIIIQRERVKRVSRIPETGSHKKKKLKEQPQASLPRYSILSPMLRDRAIAMVGVLAILVGVLLNTKIIPLPTAQPYWWLPTAIGIVAFSWAFKL
jgi:hypothetical protein